MSHSIWRTMRGRTSSQQNTGGDGRHNTGSGVVRCTPSAPHAATKSRPPSEEPEAHTAAGAGPGEEGFLPSRALRSILPRVLGGGGHEPLVAAPIRGHNRHTPSRLLHSQWLSLPHHCCFEKSTRVRGQPPLVQQPASSRERYARARLTTQMNTHAACLCLGPANALTQRQSKMLVKFENNVHEAVPVTTRAKPESEPHGYPRH